MDKVSDERRLVCFLYLLMRDHLTPGKVESLMETIEKLEQPAVFTNGFLAQHAQELADKLTID